MAKDEEKKEGEDEAKGGGKKKIIIIVVPLVLILAAAGWWFFLKPKPAAGPVVLPEPVPGAVVTIDAITVNLSGAHFLKFGMALQPIASAAEVDGSRATDLAIDQFSGMTIEELSTAEGKAKAKEELIARIKLTYVPEGTDLKLVTSDKATAAEQLADETEKAAKAKTETAAEAEKEEIHIDKLSAAEAIKLADSLTVQPEVYDLYFTEFVMQ